MTGIVRSPGQVATLSGAVCAGDLVVTSGIVDPAVLAGTAGPTADQAPAALDALIETLLAAGSDPEHVLHVQCYLADAAELAAWNEAWTVRWPTTPPARTTIVAQFAAPGIRIELQAIAVRTPPQLT